jgi:hypothetical protein
VKKVLVVVLLTAAAAFGAGYAYAAAAVKTYQVTGPVVELRADAIVVKKGTDNWEIARDSGTKVTGDPKVGDKVVIMYRMTAASIDPAAAAKKEPAKKKK